MTAIRIESLTKRFDDVVALDHVSLSIEPGELFFLLGPSGCGKTTLLRTLAGFYKPDGGSVWFADRDITKVPPHKRNFGFVFQNYALWPHMTVFENVAYGLRVRKASKEKIEADVQRALGLVQLSGLETRRPTQLSGGQQQRVALARALVIQPDVLLLDEPLSNLDAKLRLEMRDEIQRIHDELKITTVYVTHEQKEALSLADRIAVMNLGKVEQLGAPRELYARPANAFVAGFLGETNFFPATALSVGTVRAPFGELRVTSSFPGPTKEVTLSIRPEAIGVRAAGHSGSNVVAGRVDRVTYYGDQTQMVVKCGEGSSFRVVSTQLHPELAESGQPIALEIPPEAIAVFPR